jgi:putative transposase
MDRSSHLGWHSRGYLPHLDAANEIQAITFRLADSIPAEVIDSWKRELAGNEKAGCASNQILRNRIAKFEDSGHGRCVLAIPEFAEILQGALMHFDGERYRLLEWCIMPNHVHVLIHCLPGYSLPKLVASWKNYSARFINAHLGESGSLWAPDYYDRYIRDQDHFENARIYIRMNPVKAGLCKTPEEWPWSSAALRA